MVLELRRARVRVSGADARQPTRPTLMTRRFSSTRCFEKRPTSRAFAFSGSTFIVTLVSTPRKTLNSAPGSTAPAVSRSRTQARPRARTSLEVDVAHKRAVDVDRHLAGKQRAVGAVDARAAQKDLRARVA